MRRLDSQEILENFAYRRVKSKLDYICRKLRLQPGQRFLDMGCGWGALVMHAAANYGVDALGMTLSPHQANVARELICRGRLGKQVPYRGRKLSRVSRRRIVRPHRQCGRR
ncbi:MAG: hypothetical protein GEU77_11375 [Deltaproteobacteria bacterium]|nr:hypothetical protein [Deltaproteobacteria bacterium]